VAQRLWRLRADDGIRTRDPHLGKVMLYQLSHVRVTRWGSLPGNEKTLADPRGFPKPSWLIARQGFGSKWHSRPTCSAYHMTPETWAAISRRVQLGALETSHEPGPAAV
jgi:hypothetical protein